MWSVWLVFCDCGFHPVCPLMEKNKRLLKLPDGRDWLRGKLGFVLMGKAMLSKPLIQFSVEGWGCAPSLLFDLRPNYGGGNEDNGDFFKRSHALTAALNAPNPEAGHCQPRPPPGTHGQVWVSLLWGHCSFLLGPGEHKVLFVPSKKEWIDGAKQK